MAGKIAYIRWKKKFWLAEYFILGKIAFWLGNPGGTRLEAAPGGNRLEAAPGGLGWRGGGGGGWYCLCACIICHMEKKEKRKERKEEEGRRDRPT